MIQMMGVHTDVGSTFINMGLSLQEEFPGKENLTTVFDGAPFFEILFMINAPVFDVIADKAVSLFKAYDALTAKILKLNKINAYNRAILDRDAVQCVAHMIHVNPHRIGIFYSKEHQLLCFVSPKCNENAQSLEEVN